MSRRYCSLREAAEYLRDFGTRASMGVAVPAIRMIKRIDRIKSGQHQPGQTQVSSTLQDAPMDADSGEPPTEIPLEPVANEPRPPIGSLWRGGIPARRVKVTRTRDVVDIATGASLRQEISGDPGEKIRQWTSARPMGELWVDADGAVGGFVEGQERLLGYTGEDPESETARGFLVKRFYDIRDGKLIDIDSGSALRDTVRPICAERAREIEDAVAGVMEPGGTIRVTNYGDVLYLDETGTSRIAAVTPETWFPGHLG
ncbi:hypothetical protein [Microbacterium elymi]|uniref:Uncharacterized protein n=1 Tax=Microbacterium elymi TaxID=2909587 RepID=A0ABY5NMX7_9MICO|nr:hypothetical protein [Microbacterium elymi]UUT36401.1 hypothetical protein L2X98_26105 [Microbacterium elymi]